MHQERLQQTIQDSKTLTTYIDQFGKIAEPDAEPNEMTSYTLLKYLTWAYSTVSLQLINSKASGHSKYDRIY
ncbi:MAG: hypothetical protein DLM72_15395 [Candidatus Nitrosopolaris wilkensis]|nr:MAG: hypothetical protein DLM72_15395 [Candidatus Nitrosopolaris wilkensis]